MTVGNVLALLQKEMKRMLAYSSISQAGYMLHRPRDRHAPALRRGDPPGLRARPDEERGRSSWSPRSPGLGVGPLIDDWRGLGSRRPLLSVAFALMLLSLAGVPLTIGFVSKFVLFSAAVQAQGFFVWLAIAGLLNSALSVFYYGRVLKVIFFDDGGPDERPAAPSSARPGRPSLRVRRDRLRARGPRSRLIAVAIVALGIYPQPILGAIQSAAAHFVATGA